MNMLEPIKDRAIIEEIKDYLFQSNKRNYLLFVMGINLPLKSYLILRLKFSHLINEDGSIKNFLKIEGKTCYVNESIKVAIKDYIKNRIFELEDYLFQSKKTKCPINRSHLYKILNDAATSCGVTMRIGNETLRKTFGYHFYMDTRNLNKLKEMFDANSSNQLFAYLGINDMCENYNDFCI